MYGSKSGLSPILKKEPNIQTGITLPISASFEAADLMFFPYLERPLKSVIDPKSQGLRPRIAF